MFREAPVTGNSLLETWSTPFEAPPFDRIDRAGFSEAFDRAMAVDRDEVDAIANASAEPSFENTVVALERSGRLLNRVSATFFNLTGADSDETLKAIEREMAPVLSKHNSAIYLNDGLFRRIDALKTRRDELGLGAEELRLLDKWHKLFVRQGAGRSAEARTRLAEIGERLAVLGTRFGQNVLADEQAYTLVLETEEDLADR